MSKNRIPEISDARLSELYSHIRPVRKNVMGELCWLKDFSSKNLRECAFLWDTNDISVRVADTGASLIPTTTIRCLHAYASPGCFRPTIADVLAQIPPEITNGVLAFEIVGQPLSAFGVSKDGFVAEAFKDGYHVSVVQLYAAR